MSALTSDQVFRPAPQGIKGWLSRRMMAAVPFGFRLLRRFKPILRLRTTYVVTLHDDVREVFSEDAAFKVPYNDKLMVITGGKPFFLGMNDTENYRSAVAAMRRVMRNDDLKWLGDQAEALERRVFSRNRLDSQIG